MSAHWQSLDEIAQDWWANQRAELPGWTPVDEFLADQIMQGSPDCLELLQALIMAANGRQELLRIGAGPLEDLVVTHAIALVDQVERRARQDESFRIALSGVWLGAEVPATVRQRLSRLGAADFEVDK